MFFYFRKNRAFLASHAFSEAFDRIDYFEGLNFQCFELTFSQCTTEILTFSSNFLSKTCLEKPKKNKSLITECYAINIHFSSPIDVLNIKKKLEARATIAIPPDIKP